MANAVPVFPGQAVSRRRRGFTAPGAAERRLNMLASVTHGPGTAMMAFGSRLGAEEIGAVVAHIRRNYATLRIQTQPRRLHFTGVIDMSLPFAGGSWGRRSGRRLLPRAPLRCHGLDGDGEAAHIAVHPPPRIPFRLARAETANLFEAISSADVAR